MLTIAGSKGGCGTTTVTLGLAKALADRGTAAIAVDADRQLPDLHTTADVEREPTIAALDGETDVATVTKQVPGVPGVGVIPAQRSSEAVDLAAALGQLDYDSAEVLIDCPSGAGPDVVDPVSVADHVVVVTTPNDRGMEAARTTIDIAERLDVPVAGLVFTRCETPPEPLVQEAEVEVLGAIPEREDPLFDEDAGEAYADVVSSLTATAGIGTVGSGVPQRADRLPTGVDGLDRLLGGGVPPGSVVALEAPPVSQAELLLYNLTATRGTLYLTTERSEAAVRDALAESPVEVGSPTIRRLDGGAPLAEARTLIDNLPAGANLVIDAADPLETADREDYVEFLNGLKDRTMAADGLTVLYCLDRQGADGLRGLTEHFADAVVSFRTEGEEYGVELGKFRAESDPNRYEQITFRESVPIEVPEFQRVEADEAR